MESVRVPSPRFCLILLANLHVVFAKRLYELGSYIQTNSPTCVVCCLDDHVP
jgi:hypothetical protein